jgi:cobaltochelatase CobS
MLFVGKLIRYANRRHRGAAPVAVADTGAIVTKVMAQVEQQIGAKTGIDVDKLVTTVSARVLSEMEKRVPREVKITVERADGKLHKVKGPTHCKFNELCEAATTRLPHGYAPGIFLQGEASSGKTTGAKMLAEVLGLDWYFNGAISFPHEMLGFIDGAGKYHRTPFRDAYEFGGVYTFDEVDRSDPNALLAVNPHLANGIATFPDKQVKRHKDCIIICTANTWGLGADANYSGATKLDGAFLDRFEVRINWDIDTKLEEEIVKHPEWLAMVRSARAKARANGLKVMISVRAALAGAALIKQKGYSLEQAANATFLANLKPDQRKQVMS